MRTLFFSLALAVATAAAAQTDPSINDGSRQAQLEQLSDQAKEIGTHPENFLGDPLKLQKLLHPDADQAAQEQAEQIAEHTRSGQNGKPSSQQALRSTIEHEKCVIEVYVSQKFLEDNLIELSDEAAVAKRGGSQCETFAYIRGLPPGKTHVDDLVKWFMQLERKLPTAQRSFTLLLDPASFRKRQIVEYPVTYVRDGTRTANARGTGSPHYMLEELASGHAGDLGKVGATAPIPEEDLIVDLQRRMAAIDWDKKKRAAFSRYWSKVSQFNLPVAKVTSSRLLDMTYRLEQDVKDGKGKVLFKEGTEFNPMDSVVPIRLALCIFDPTKPGQLEYARNFAHAASRSGLRVKYIISQLSGDPHDAWDKVQDDLHSPAYILDQSVIDRFQIVATPTIVVADRSQVIITEVPVDGNHAADPNEALPRYDRVAAEQAPNFDVEHILATAFAPLRWMAEAVSTDAEAASGAMCPDAQIFGAGLVSGVCWDCIFPMIIAQIPIGGGQSPREAYRGAPICFCPGIYDIPDPGVTLSMWQPSNIIELVRHAYCMPTLGGVTLQQGARLQGGDYVAAKQDNHGRGAFYNYHMYAFPLLALLNLFVTSNCGMDFTDFDLTYVSEIDPTWNDDELADMLNPESVLFTNPVAEAMCLADAAAGIAAQEGIGDLFWCAGTWGVIYPFSGTVESNGSIPRDTSLIATKAIAALHRRLLMNLEMTYATLCVAAPAPTMVKGQYKMETMYPIPEPASNHWLGQSTFTWGEWRAYPGPGEDFVYLLWRWRDCCDTMYQAQ